MNFLRCQIEDLKVEIVVVLSHEHTFAADCFKLGVSQFFAYELVRFASKYFEMRDAGFSQIPYLERCAVVSHSRCDSSVGNKHRCAARLIPEG